ncbi:hypothetical protein DXG01_013053, partial [Tephrocybe rancida]
HQPDKAGLDYLPIEILTNILCYCIPVSTEESFVHQIMLLCHVCSFWRETLLGIPSLWKTLSFDLDTNHCNTYDLQQIMDFFFTHAKDHLLSLSVCSFGESNQTKVYKILDHIFPFAARLLQLEVELDYIDDIPFFQEKGGLFPALENLSISIFGRAGTVSDGLPIAVFDSAPALRTLTLGILSRCLREQSHFACSWHQLTRLDFEDPVHPKTFYDIITQCKSLKQALFNITADEGDEIEEFPHLYDLEISFEDAFKDETLFLNLAFPNLRFFELRIEKTDEPVTFTTIPPGINPASLR